MKRDQTGRVGETLAAWYLQDNGVTILARNVAVPGGEIDLLGLDRGVRVAFEVRARVGGPDPVDAAGATKRSHVGRLGRAVGAGRADLIGVRVGQTAFDIHWVPSIG